jgi:hypothetical protein
VGVADVIALESLAPGTSTEDAIAALGKIWALRRYSVQERQTVCENFFAFKGIVPSLSRFFKDVHLLEAYADSMKLLVKVPSDKTLYTALGKYYRMTNDFQQALMTENTPPLQIESQEHCQRLGYLVLAAFALRERRSLPKNPPEKNPRAIPRVSADPAVLQRFASLAAKLGFHTPQVLELKGEADLPIPDTQVPRPLLVTTGKGEKIKHRSGIPYTRSFEEDRKSLFLHNLCEERDETGEGITSFFVLKSWFAAFFDTEEWRLASMLGSPGQPPPPAHPQNEVDVEMRNAGTQQESTGQAAGAVGTAQGDGLFGNLLVHTSVRS